MLEERTACTYKYYPIIEYKIPVHMLGLIKKTFMGNVILSAQIDAA